MRDVILVAVAASLVLAGSGLVLIYLWEGVFMRLGDPDQSPLFWYLPVLLIGVFCLMVGILLFIKTPFARKR